ncbi:hypothetical protein GLOTRDRAFT_96792 [Gloeophyllum trabeum ATCC 11539]|uniref:Uncharacterized protein n=1 Tax=Gloeophyllum trabeum (strain ATCC 11539 / FP-39264 / Madison 617) TaxID=670483 RepID=S7R9B7_GLOTA|nr:uncharacterized protein GLOTRDRAFT_96792 [Gloeophyllum trabeum ATCC 11539]EPQ50875.1 hypothetical protein GLOTRDRAFT_96792 [Gloeophyllum trabeum ATCC 11539]
MADDTVEIKLIFDLRTQDKGGVLVVRLSRDGRAPRSKPCTARTSSHPAAIKALSDPVPVRDALPRTVNLVQEQQIQHACSACLLGPHVAGHQINIWTHKSQSMAENRPLHRSRVSRTVATSGAEAAFFAEEGSLARSKAAIELLQVHQAYPMRAGFTYEDDSSHASAVTVRGNPLSLAVEYSKGNSRYDYPVERTVCQARTQGNRGIHGSITASFKIDTLAY